MTGYKYKILTELQKHGWELSEVIDSDLDWWADEQWQIKSVRENWGQEIYITFVVDPHWSGNRKKGQGIWEVVASSSQLITWNDKSSEVAALFMSRGKFDPKLEAFIQKINTYRNTPEKPEGS
jgi:hypothetical protein